MIEHVAVVKKCPDTGYYVGMVPDVPGFHSQGETLDELETNLKEVKKLLQTDLSLSDLIDDEPIAALLIIRD